jgi:RNA polymerase-binding transcription factor DksA
MQPEARPEHVAQHVAEDEAEPRPSAALDAADGDLRAVEAALVRLDDGSYGRCDLCGGSIPAESLTADPLARTCAEHEVGPVDAPA